MKLDPAEANLDEDIEAEKSLIYRAFNSVFWVFLGSGFHLATRMVVLVVLARLLTPEDYGLVGAAMIVVGFTALFSQLGVGQVLVQRPQLEERHVRTAFTLFTVIGVLVGVLIAISAPLIALFFQMDELAPIVRTMTLAFPLQGLIVVPTALLTRELQFRWLTGISAIGYAVGYGIVGIGLALLGFGAWSLVGAELTHLVVRAIFLPYLQPFPMVPQFDRRAFRDLIYLGGGFTLDRIFNQVALQGDNLVVGRWLGAGALGVYSRAFQLAKSISEDYFSLLLDRVLFPSMAKVQHDAKRLEFAYRCGISVTAVLLLPISAAALVLAPEFILVLFGPAWTEVVVPFQILAAGMVFQANNKMSNSVAYATGAVYRKSWRQAVFMLLIVGCAWIGQHWGVAGVAAGVLIALLVNYVLMTHLSMALTSMTLKSIVIAHLPGLLSAAVTFVVLWSVATVLRNLAMPAFMILFVSSVVTGLSLFVLVYLMPHLFLGQDGIWMLRTLANYAQKRLNRFKWVQRMKSYKIYRTGAADTDSAPATEGTLPR